MDIHGAFDCCKVAELQTKSVLQKYSRS